MTGAGPDARSERRSVIDVGTNSIKLLVADVTEREQVTPVFEGTWQTRLGAGFYDRRELRASAISETARAVASFREQALKLGSAPPRVFATSAAREAANAQALVDAIRDECDLSLEILSGEREAEWAYIGIRTHPDFRAGPILMQDTGGGSTQLILGGERAIRWRKSVALGAVRLLEHFTPGDLPASNVWSRCREHIDGLIRQEIEPEWPIERRGEGLTFPYVAAGGTATILARMELELATFDRAPIEGCRLTAERVRFHRERLWSLPLAERRKLVGLPPDRADVMLMGAAIYEAMVDWLGVREMRVTTRGLRFAALLRGV